MKKRYWKGTWITLALLVVVAVATAAMRSVDSELYKKNEIFFVCAVCAIMAFWIVWQIVNVVIAIAKRKRSKQGKVDNTK